MFLAMEVQVIHKFSRKLGEKYRQTVNKKRHER